MAETRLANVITPEVFMDAVDEPSIYRSRFVKNGGLALSDAISNTLAGGGDSFNLTSFQDIENDEGQIPSETSELTVGGIGQVKQTYLRIIRENAIGTNALASIMSGNDVLVKIEDRMVGYWASVIDKIAFAILSGVYKSNVANESGDLVVGGATTAWSGDLVIDAQSLLGENGVVGAGDGNGDFKMIVVSPATLKAMRLADDIDIVPVSDQGQTIELYKGMRVITDRFTTVPVAGQSLTYLLKEGALQYGSTQANMVPAEISRNALQGGGIDILVTRRNLAIHPVGYQCTATVAGTVPTNAELDIESAWTRVFEKENSGVVIIHTLDAV